MTAIVIIDENNKERERIVDETNFKIGTNFGPGTIVMGMDGKAYENYGTEDKPFWEEIFDASYRILTIEED
jgi:hypothetical protein